MVNNHCRTAGNVLGGQLSSYIERHLLSLSRTKNEEKGISQNGIHDIIRETLIRDSISVSLIQEPFKNRWYETEEHGYERKNEAVLPRCNDETREKIGGGKQTFHPLLFETA